MGVINDADFQTYSKPEIPEDCACEENCVETKKEEEK